MYKKQVKRIIQRTEQEGVQGTTSEINHSNNRDTLEPVKMTDD